MRYSKTEQLGVNATERIFLDDFDWIFRSQPVADVGIDALVEQVENGEPKGKFIALQIKSGKGNFHISDSKLIYYLTNIHYNYWIKFDIPIILVAHIPESAKTYWVEITRNTIKKTSKKWKIEIPKQNILNAKAKPILTSLLSNSGVDYRSIKIFNGEDIDTRTIYDIAEKASCISDSTESTMKSVALLEEFTSKINESNEKFTTFNQMGLALDSPQMQAALRTYAKNMNICAKRLESECLIFSETFAEGIIAFEQAIRIQYLYTKDSSLLLESLNILKELPDAIDRSIDGIEVMKNAIDALPSKIHLLRESKRNMISVINFKLNEYKEAKRIVNDLLQSEAEIKIKSR